VGRHITDSFRWAGVELRHLLALRAIVEEGSLAAAARRLGYSQPAVTQQLVAFEHLIGATLVERRAGARSVAMTDVGSRVLRHARAILAQAQAADAELRELEDGATGTLFLGTTASTGARIVPNLLRELAEVAPGINVELIEDGWDTHLLDKLEAGDADLVFAFLPLRRGAFSHIEVFRDPYVLLVAADAPITSTRPLTLARLARLPLIVCSQSTAAEAFCEANGFAAQIRYRIDDNETLLGLAAAGLGVALVPRLAVGSERSDVRTVELAVKPPARIIALVWHKDRELQQAARTVVEVARTVCRDLAAKESRPSVYPPAARERDRRAAPGPGAARKASPPDSVSGGDA
jgi:molybdate transport repressor ModE-like protein